MGGDESHTDASFTSGSLCCGALLVHVVAVKPFKKLGWWCLPLASAMHWYHSRKISDDGRMHGKAVSVCLTRMLHASCRCCAARQGWLFKEGCCKCAACVANIGHHLLPLTVLPATDAAALSALWFIVSLFLSMSRLPMVFLPCVLLTRCTQHKLLLREVLIHQTIWARGPPPALLRAHPPKLGLQLVAAASTQ